MPKVCFVQADGAEVLIEAPPGETIMSIAVGNNVRGIDGECGGCLSCATCHVYLDGSQVHLFPPPAAEEEDMLGFVDGAREATSRLSCQLQVPAGLDVLRVRVPPR